MKTTKNLLPVLLLPAIVAFLVPVSATMGQRPPEPVAQPTPAATPAPTPAATPVPAAAGDEKEKPEEKKWNVEAPPYPMNVEATIDTDEGTWMSLDVSPDGREIVFDLLGDIYSIPIAGGEARALTTGVSWDMQPRYSPDGSRIAFTSDRSGGDNVWVMDRDGSRPTQVTKEDFRLPNSAVWAPDGDFLAARKHFTGTRSLGAGEIWLYHRSGGEGTQMVKRSNEQKDLGEPAFSPDGRYLYYSQDVTPGRIFQYNKNPHEQIYAIQRLDRVDRPHRPVRAGAGRFDPADAVARRQVARVRAPRALPDRPVHQGPGVGSRETPLRGARPRHAGDVGGPGRLSLDGVDAGQPRDRRVGRREDPPDRAGRRSGFGRSVPRSRDAPDGSGRALLRGGSRRAASPSGCCAG